MDRIGDLAALRRSVKAGECRGAAFRKMVEERVRVDYDQTGYDELDEFVNELLFVGEMPAPTVGLEREMVEYYKTPARIVFDWVERMEFGDDDLFYDLGSGLGQVTMLMNLLTGVRARGLEIEPAYCAYARGCADRLGLREADFSPGDVRDMDLSDGTIFFLYTPFTGEILQTVLSKLQSISGSIRILACGPCLEVVERQDWLTPLPGSAGNFSTGQLATKCFITWWPRHP
jgi:SAM-dependent methyltransferase